MHLMTYVKIKSVHTILSKSSKKVESVLAWKGYFFYVKTCVEHMWTKHILEKKKLIIFILNYVQAKKIFRTFTTWNMLIHNTYVRIVVAYIFREKKRIQN